MIFKKHEKQSGDIAEQRFNTLVTLVRDLDATEFKRLMSAAELVHQAYEKTRKVQTRDEKEEFSTERMKAFLEIPDR